MAEEILKTETENETLDYKAEYEKLIAENEKLRQTNTKASAEASRYKKELSEKLSQTELEQREREEQAQKTAELLKGYQERERVMTYRTKLMECGYDPETAQNMAQNLPEGIKDEFFTATRDFRNNEIAKIKAEALNTQPKLSAGTIPTPPDKDLELFRKGAGLK